MKKRILAAILVAVLVLCSLSGCKGTTAPTTAPSSDNSPSSGETTHANEIVVGIPQDLDSLDPFQMGTAGTREVMFNVFEGLVKLRPDGSYADAVAFSHTVSDDGLRYTFTLRDNVYFHNGNPVTVADIVYSLNTCVSSSVNQSVAGALSVATVTTEGNDIILTLDTANSDFLAYMSNAYIIPEGYTDQATAPIGTGPFQFESYSVQDRLVLTKNDKYYGTPAMLDKVTFKIFASTDLELTALNSGSLDLVAHLQFDQIDTLTNGYTVLDGTMNLAVGMYLNHAYEPFSHEEVRQALCYAVDIDEIMALATGGQGVKIGSSMFPNFGKYFEAGLANTYPHDVAKARELLSQAGYADGFSFQITYATEYEHPYGDMAQAIQQQLSAVGITVELNPVEWANWYSETYSGRNFEATIVGFDTSVLSATGMLQRWTSDANRNMINYNNPEYDRIYAEAVACTDDTQQTALYKQCLEILNQTAANVYIQDLAEYVVINPALDGYQFYPLYIMDMSTVHVK